MTPIRLCSCAAAAECCRLRLQLLDGDFVDCGLCKLHHGPHMALGASTNPLASSRCAEWWIWATGAPGIMLYGPPPIPA